MRSFFVLIVAAAFTGFGFGVTASTSAQSAAHRIAESRAARYCEVGLTEFC